ncbi:hypothetical protein LGL88_12250 [Yersinia ruckeri]|uniref:hypothetical protein n=1 Tax=Yersinia ruckeri TaxID=29486 RepID=UPI001F38524D|nr:hypothetical protein [Yersinia ruckeri]EKN4704203.1 hypothetical protein [Yersinia ruckeri]MCW6600764.1 hypothetical protein [Yersinia ruckeri]UIN06514.1 hypothetical protein LGL88_12250 [Yersinia ruckeri]
MSENTDYDKACREIARIAAALGIVDYSGDTSEIFDAIIIKDENHQALAGENVVLNKALDGTTATTQALNEIKAQGVEMFSEFCKQKAEIRAYNFFTDAGNVAEEFAASLRSEHHG